MDWQKLLSFQTVGQKQPKDSNARSAFERDFDRIIFSHPFRRLQDKTQVFPLPEQDFVHTRLTHSLEVSSVGRSLGKLVGEKVLQKHTDLQAHLSLFDFGAIVAAASLTHDLGNPPFGHTGESAISDFFLSHPQGQFFKDKVSQQQWADLTDFEGNAQGFRILNQPELGLKLTQASLAAFTKYPRGSNIPNQDSKRKSQKKYGFFQSEQELFTEIAEAIGLKRLSAPEAIWCRHPLAFLVEAADDICYHLIDLEDGCRLGLVSEETTIDLMSQIVGAQFKPKKLAAVEGKENRIGLLRAMSIGNLIKQCGQVFLENEKDILSGGFDRALTDLIESKNVLKEIIDLSVEKIYRAPVVIETEAAGFEVLAGLLEVFNRAAYRCIFERDLFAKRDSTIVRLLPQVLQSKLQPDVIEDAYSMLRITTDFVSGLTDRHAISLYRKIKGISIPGI